MNNIKSLRDHVCTYINEKIKCGELKPHEKLNEVQICNDLDISRTPTREALIMLASDHIIDFIPRKGFFVREITVDDMLQYYALIGTLDSFAATLAVDNLDEKDFLKLSELAANMDVAIDFNNFHSYITLQQDFHDLYIKKSGNKPLIETITSLKNSFIPITYTDKNIDEKTYKEILHTLNSEHKKIIELFIAKDKKALEKFIKEEHWQTRHKELL